MEWRWQGHPLNSVPKMCTYCIASFRGIADECNYFSATMHLEEKKNGSKCSKYNVENVIIRFKYNSFQSSF